MSLPLSTLLYPYWTFLVIFVVGVLLDMWHMAKYGTYGVRNALALVIFFAGIGAILWWTTQFLIGVDWSRPIVEGLTITLPGG